MCAMPSALPFMSCSVTSGPRPRPCMPTPNSGRKATHAHHAVGSPPPGTARTDAATCVQGRHGDEPSYARSRRGATRVRHAVGLAVSASRCHVGSQTSPIDTPTPNRELRATHAPHVVDFHRPERRVLTLPRASNDATLTSRLLPGHDGERHTCATCRHCRTALTVEPKHKRLVPQPKTQTHPTNNNRKHEQRDKPIASTKASNPIGTARSQKTERNLRIPSRHRPCGRRCRLEIPFRSAQASRRRKTRRTECRAPQRHLGLSSRHTSERKKKKKNVGCRRLRHCTSVLCQLRH